MDEEATRAIREAKAPTDKVSLQSFLGLVNHYRNHVPNMSDIAAPMNNLLRKEADWVWDKECEKSFNEVKEILTSKDTLLVHYDLGKKQFWQYMLHK